MNYDITFCEGGKAFGKTNATATASCYATAPTKTRTKNYTFQCADRQTQTNAPSF